MLRIIELFAGIGSQTQALKNIGVPHEAVAVSEIDKYAVQSYEALHGKVNNLGDIKTIEELPEADLWTYSFPCTDISVAGKGEGLNRGGGTKSGLLWEVERLLFRARDNGTLPKYLLMENVKNLTGHKHKANFDMWLAFLSSLGYRSYWKVLNAKHYGVPQNRERVFCISILGGHEPYVFPEKVPLELRLKDMLEDEVDERYYLSGAAVNRIINSTFEQEKRRVLTGELAPTLCARDYKDPKCVVAGNLEGGKWDKIQEHCRRIYDADGISPCVHCAQGGNTELKVAVAGQFQPTDRDYKEKGLKREEQFECRKDDLANAVLTGDKKNCVCIVAQRGRPNEDGKNVQRLEPNGEGLCNTLTSVQKDNLLLEPQVLKTQRTDYGKAVRKAYESHELEAPRRTMTEQVPREDGVSNTLTTVRKDNLLCVGYYKKNMQGYRVYDTEGISATITARGGGAGEQGGALYKDVIVYDDYNSRVREDGDTIGTLTTNIGASAVRNGYKIIEKHVQKDDAEYARTVRVGGRGSLDKHSWDVIRIKNATKQGYLEAEAGDGVNIQYPDSKTRRGRVGKGVSGTLMCNSESAVVTDDIRIRKLTPKECLRLMGWTDAQIDMIQASGVSNSQQYKQAGNGIVVQVLEAIFRQLFLGGAYG